MFIANRPGAVRPGSARCGTRDWRRDSARPERLLRESGLPSGKTLGNLVEGQLPTKVRRQLPTLLEGGFIERAENLLVFGLPGNPVAALVSFHQLIKPALLRLAGQREWCPVVLPARLSQERQKKKGRLEWVRSVITRRGRRLIARPTDGQKSHMLTGLAAANGLMEFPAERAVLRSQACVAVHWLTWA